MTLSLSNSPAVAFLATADAEAALPFYRDVLGLTFLADEPFALVFDLDGSAHLRIGKTAQVVAPPYTMLGFTVPDIHGAIGELAARGVTFERFDGLPQDDDGVARFGPAQVAWFKDPDGQLLSLSQVD